MKKLLTLVMALCLAVSAFVVAPFVTSNVSTAEAATEKTADVYFIAGQSNAAGYSMYKNGSLYNLGKYESVRTKSYSNVLYYGYAGNWESANGGKTDLNLDPVKEGLGMWSSAIGPELGMANYLQDQYKNIANTDAIIVKYAIGSSSLTCGQGGCPWGNWCAPSKHKPTEHIGENFYDNMIGTKSQNYTDGFIYQAILKMKSKGYTKINFKGLFWAQGEAESSTATYYNAYAENLSAFISDFRSDLYEVAKYAKFYNNTLNVSDPTNMGFAISEICLSFYGATVSGGVSSRTGNNVILEKEREVATDTTSSYYRENVSLLNTQSYTIKKHGEAGNYADANNDKIADGTTVALGKYCYDNAHYAGEDIVDIGIRAGEMMYAFTVGDDVVVEKPSGLWISVNGYETMRSLTDSTLFTSSIDTSVTVNVVPTLTDGKVSNADITLNFDSKYELDSLEFRKGLAGSYETLSTDKYTVNGNKIIIDSTFYNNLFKTYEVVFLNIKTKLKEVKTVTVTTAGASVILEGIADQNVYNVGDVVKFKIYLADKKDLGNKKIASVKYNDTKATLDSDGFFNITITNEAESKLQIRLSSVNFGTSDYPDYDLVLYSSVDVGEPEVPNEPTPDPETPSDGGTSGGMNCQMGIGSASILFAVIACLGAVVIASKRFIKSK